MVKNIEKWAFFAPKCQSPTVPSRVLAKVSHLRGLCRNIVSARHQNQPARRVRYPKDSLHHAFYFFGVTDGLAAAPPSSTAKVQCASTFLPPDFASTMTLHLSRSFFVT